ncbi:hypothetical protein EI94DRAFT_205851 [Lactarius quietus]|nr:hypothetical protein EI94DRAFT_205851 [Lactarius quietus]
MYPSIILRSGRPAWKGPFFVSFPNLREALTNNTPIKTDAVHALSCPISLGGCSHPLFTRGGQLNAVQDPLSRAQRKGLPACDNYAGYGWAQVGGVFAYEKALRVQVRRLLCICEQLSLT